MEDQTGSVNTTTKISIGDQLLFVRNGGETRRYHGWPVLRQQTDAEHCFHVAMILHILYGQDEPGLRPVVIMAALCSDLGEWISGDIPSPSKRAMDHIFPDFRAKWNEMEESNLAKVALDWKKFLTPEEERMLSFADAVEGAMYCIRERAMGNKFIGACFRVYIRYLETFLLEPYNSAERECVNFIHAQWVQANDACSIDHWEKFCGR